MDLFLNICNIITMPLFFTEKPDRNSTPSKVWMAKGLLASSKKKNKLYLKSIKQPTALNISNYKNYRNKFKAIKVKMESKYYEQEFAKHAHDTKNTWRVIKSLLNGSTGADKINALRLNDEIVTDPFTLAQAFNGFFSEVGASFEQKIPVGVKSVNDYFDCPAMNSFALIPTTFQKLLI